jgi:predicted nucleic acid-binding protein
MRKRHGGSSNECAGDLYLLPVEPATFHSAAILSLDVASGLRAGDALHLAAALAAKARGVATLDEVMAKNAKRLRLKLAAI